jgi:hypothetical protein
MEEGRGMDVNLFYLICCCHLVCLNWTGKSSLILKRLSGLFCAFLCYENYILSKQRLNFNDEIATHPFSFLLTHAHQPSQTVPAHIAWLSVTLPTSHDIANPRNNYSALSIPNNAPICWASVPLGSLPYLIRVPSWICLRKPYQIDTKSYFPLNARVLLTILYETLAWLAVVFCGKKILAQCVLGSTSASTKPELVTSAARFSTFCLEEFVIDYTFCRMDS